LAGLSFIPGLGLLALFAARRAKREIRDSQGRLKGTYTVIFAKMLSIASLVFYAVALVVLVYDFSPWGPGW
jgi:hypothetical protein